MADAIKTKHGVAPEMIPGSGGVFDVVADGKTVFSKHKAGRFPENAEVLDELSRIKR